MVPAMPNVGTSKDKGLIKRKRALEGPPELRGAVAVGAAGTGPVSRAISARPSAKPINLLR